MPWGDHELPRRHLERMFPNTFSTLETGPQTPGLMPWPVYSLFGLHSNSIPHVSPCCWKGVLPAGSLRSLSAVLLDSPPSLLHRARHGWDSAFIPRALAYVKMGRAGWGEEPGQWVLPSSICPMNGSRQSQAESGAQSPPPCERVRARREAIQLQWLLWLLPGTAGNSSQSRGRAGGMGVVRTREVWAGQVSTRQAGSSLSGPGASLAS